MMQTLELSTHFPPPPSLENCARSLGIMGGSSSGWKSRPKSSGMPSVVKYPELTWLTFAEKVVLNSPDELSSIADTTCM